MLDMREQLQQIKEVMVKENNNTNNTLKNEVKHIDNKMGQNIEKVETIESKTNYDNNTTYNKEIRKPQRKEIWYVDFGYRKGSLQNGIRPAIVDSNDISNRFSNIINVYPLTSQVLSKADIPVHVRINGYGLKEESMILIEQVTTIDIRFQLKDYIGTVDELVMKKVNNAKKIQFGDVRPKTKFERLSVEKQKNVLDKLNSIKECEIALKFLNRINGNIQDIDRAEDDKFEAENALMTFCYDNSINPEEFYSVEKGINAQLKELIAL